MTNPSAVTSVETAPGAADPDRPGVRARAPGWDVTLRGSAKLIVAWVRGRRPVHPPHTSRVRAPGAGSLDCIRAPGRRATKPPARRRATLNSRTRVALGSDRQ